MEKELKEALQWACENEISFKMFVKDGEFGVFSYNKNMASRWGIEEVNLLSIGTAVYGVLGSLSAAEKYHMAHGFMPERGAGQPKSEDS